jgi:hypothetical protein
VIAGRLTFANRTTFPRHLDFELCGLLSPLGGKAFGPAQQQQMVRILAGSTGGLEPVVFMSGGPRRGIGPHPALTVSLDFEAGVSRSLTWACATKASLVESFELARRVAGRNWDAERARLELLNARHIVDIFTGDPDWDAALALSQKAAFSVFFPGGDHLPNPSFVRTRTPDNGHSRKGDGSDHAPSWNGQSPFDAYYLSSLLPAAPELRLGLRATSQCAGGDDHRCQTGLAGQRFGSRRAAARKHGLGPLSGDSRRPVPRRRISETPRLLQLMVRRRPRPGCRWNSRMGASAPDRL